MSRVAQAFDSRPVGIFGSACVKAVALAAILPLAGCGAGGFSLEKADVDRSIITSNVPAASAAGDSSADADQATIRNAVSSADIEGLAGQSVPWANSDTGSRGSITGLAEYRDSGRLCRRFSTSRESFDGVAMFSGEACLVGVGAWRMEDFKAL